MPAHELTHTIQQGAGISKKGKSGAQAVHVQTKPTLKPGPATPAAHAAPVAVGNDIVDLTGGSFDPPEAMVKYFTEGHKKEAQINVKFGSVAKGTILINYRNKKFSTAANQYIPLNISYLAGKGIDPVLVTQIRDGKVTGYASFAGKGGKVGGINAIKDWVEEHTTELGWLGMDKIKLSKVINTIENGAFNFGFTNVPVRIGGFVDAKLNLALQNNNVVFNAAGTINIPKLTSANIDITRAANGELSGGVKMSVAMSDFSGSIDAVYKNGNLNIEGNASYATKKMKGTMHIFVTDAAIAKGMALQHIDPGQAPPVAPPAEEKSPKKGAAKSEARAVAGWGELYFNFTDWMTGKAKVIVDSEGHVTVIGDITPQKEVNLFNPPQKNFNKPLIDVEAKATYGIPVVGDLFLFAKVGLSAIAVLGPAKIDNIVIGGTYSTDPAIKNDISMKARFSISAYAGLRLAAQAGIGLEILEHDIKFGIEVDADLGIRGYAEATPQIGWREKTPGGDGEFYINGHVEIAAQPFLGLSGKLFVDLDTPWWSPLSDGRYWTQPLFDKEWPLPGEFGIGADVADYVLGSGKVPDINFSEVNFDKEKFISDLTDDNLKAGGDKNKQGKGNFIDKGAKTDAPSPPPPPVAKAPGSGGGKTASAGGAKQKPKKGDKEIKKEEGMRMKEAMAKVKAMESKKPMTKDEITAAVEQIKAEYKVPVTFKAQGNDFWLVTINVKGKGSKQPAKVKAIMKPGDEKEVKEDAESVSAAVKSKVGKELSGRKVEDTDEEKALMHSVFQHYSSSGLKGILFKPNKEHPEIIDVIVSASLAEKVAQINIKTSKGMDELKKIFGKMTFFAGRTTIFVFYDNDHKPFGKPITQKSDQAGHAEWYLKRQFPSLLDRIKRERSELKTQPGQAVPVHLDINRTPCDGCAESHIQEIVNTATTEYKDVPIKLTISSASISERSQKTSEDGLIALMQRGVELTSSSVWIEIKKQMVKNGIEQIEYRNRAYDIDRINEFIATSNEVQDLIDKAVEKMKRSKPAPIIEGSGVADKI